MLVSYNWLKQYTNVEDNATDLAEKITRGGIEIEGVDYLAEEISNVVVGYVESKEKHPDAEKLSVSGKCRRRGKSSNRMWCTKCRCWTICYCSKSWSKTTRNQNQKS